MMNKLAKILTALGLLISVSACASAEQGGDKTVTYATARSFSSWVRKKLKSGDACQFILTTQRHRYAAFALHLTEGQLACKTD
ncbi:MAG: hypothetical protein IPI79_15485 [Moraxellaceae bacterium]|nr:hypothetical protein [Moraxellaceae bacterium]